MQEKNFFFNFDKIRRNQNKYCDIYYDLKLKIMDERTLYIYFDIFYFFTIQFIIES